MKSIYSMIQTTPMKISTNPTKIENALAPKTTEKSLQMEFSEKEISFLLRPHHMETADAKQGKGRSLDAAIDLRQIGCPTGLFTKVLEQRATKLGPKFREFRASHHVVDGTPEDNLASLIQVSRLF
jgi:hypothetical protein